MAKYRKIDPQIWNDAKFREFSTDAKLVFMFLLTHPNMTAIGAMRGSIPGLAAELGWTVEGFGKGFAIPFREGLVKHDERACLVWLPNFLRYNPPENPNVVKHWLKAYSELPECDLRSEVYQSLKRSVEGLPKGFKEPFAKQSRNGMANQEQEQEQDIKKNIKKKKTPIPEPFTISEGVQAWADKNGFNQLDKHLENFVFWAKAKDQHYVDWDCAFKKAIRDNWAKVAKLEVLA